MRRLKLPLRSQPPHPLHRRIRQQTSLIEPPPPLRSRKKRHRDHQQVPRSLSCKIERRLRHPRTQQLRQRPHPLILQQMDHLPKLILVAPIADRPRKLRRRKPAGKTLHPAKSQVFHLKLSIDPIPTPPASRGHPPLQPTHTLVTNRHAPSMHQRPAADATIPRKNCSHDIPNRSLGNAPSNPYWTSKHPHNRSPCAFGRMTTRASIQRPTGHDAGRTPLHNLELPLQAFAEDSPTRRRSRSVRPRHERSIAPIPLFPSSHRTVTLPTTSSLTQPESPQANASTVPALRPRL